VAIARYTAIVLAQPLSPFAHAQSPHFNEDFAAQAMRSIVAEAA
jgi:hypothetical protein